MRAARGKGTWFTRIIAAVPCHRTHGYTALLWTAQKQRVLQSRALAPARPQLALVCITKKMGSENVATLRSCCSLITHTALQEAHTAEVKETWHLCSLQSLTLRGGLQPFLCLVSKLVHAPQITFESGGIRSITLDSNNTFKVQILLGLTLKPLRAGTQSRGCCTVTKISTMFCKTFRNLMVTCVLFGPSLQQSQTNNP